MPRTKFEAHLDSVHERLQKMAQLVAENLDENFAAFDTHDKSYAKKVRGNDIPIDNMHQDLEEQVMTMLAMAHPLAGHDLRDIMAAMLIAYELERMGDYAKSIGRYMVRHDLAYKGQTPDELLRMKAQCKEMLVHAVQAYIEGNTALARQTVLQDENIDRLKKSLFDASIQRIKEGKLSIEDGTYLLWVGHKLERFADRTVTISLRAAYVEMGHMPYFERDDSTK